MHVTQQVLRLILQAVGDDPTEGRGADTPHTPCKDSLQIASRVNPFRLCAYVKGQQIRRAENRRHYINSPTIRIADKARRLQ